MLAIFQLYGRCHLLTLLLLVVVTFFLIRFFRSATKPQSQNLGVITLAVLCFVSYPLNVGTALALGSSQPIEQMLPFHLCDLTAFLCGFALLTRRPLLCELSYFWGLAGTLQGVLTPDLSREFPDPLYISFFLQHGIIVITALVLPLGLSWRPRPRSALRAYWWLLLYAVVIFGVNFVLKTNFAFVMAKPDGDSLLNVLGDWPWYIIWTLLISFVMFLLLELPFLRKNRSPQEN